MTRIISRWTLLIILALAIMAPRNAVAQAQSEAPDQIYPGRYASNCKPAGNSVCFKQMGRPGRRVVGFYKTVYLGSIRGVASKYIKYLT